MKCRLVLTLVMMLAPIAVFGAHKKDIWAGSGYEPTDVAMELKQASPHVYYVQGQAGTPTEHDGFISNACRTRNTTRQLLSPRGKT